MERKVNKIYNEAYDDISEDWIKYMDSHAPKLQKAYDDLQAAIVSGDKTAIDEAKAVYQRTAMNITVNSKRFQGMADETAAKISHVNDVALAYVNDQVPSIYTINYNAFGDENITGYSFSLVNEQAVKNLAKSDKVLLPTKKLDIPKDMRWNEKQINSQMVQGILQGESVPKLAKRLRNVTDMNRVSAIRNARTITTAAENKGRQDSFKKASDDGVIMKRRWVAAHDDHTRAWHLDLHGVEVGVDEPFENDYGEIMYPADPTAHPANVYNCRCAIRAVIKGFAWDNSSIEPETPTLKGLSKPERPFKGDFDNYDDYLTAREAYKSQKEMYNERVDDWIEKSIPNAISKQEFSKWCNEQHVKIYGDISQVDDRALAAYKKRMDDLFRDFPEVRDYRQAFNIPDEFKFYEFGFENTLDYIAEASHGFKFGSAGKDMVDLMRQQADAVSTGFRVLGDGTINQLFDHEFGHNVYNSLQNIEDRTEEGFQRRLRLRDDLVKSVYGKDGHSEYSTTNDDELFAEAFSAWYGGENTEFATSMGQFLKRWGVIK